MNKYVVWIVIGFVVAFVVSGAFAFLAAASGADAGFIPMMIGMIAGVFTAYIGANLAGNRKTPAASSEQKAAALTLVAPEGQALLVVMREGFVGMAAGMNVTLDGRTVAQLKSPRFTAIPLVPGDHVVTLAFGGLAKAQNRDNDLTFTAAAGEVIAFKATMAMGAMKNTIKSQRIPTDTETERMALRNRLATTTMTAPDALI